jgi:hypothetical protein
VVFPQLQGYLSYQKRTPLGPYRRPVPKGPRGILGGWAFSYGRGTPVNLQWVVLCVAT